MLYDAPLSQRNVVPGEARPPGLARYVEDQAAHSEPEVPSRKAALDQRRCEAILRTPLAGDTRCTCG